MRRRTGVIGGLFRLWQATCASVLAIGCASLAQAGETITFFHNDVAGTPMLV